MALIDLKEGIASAFTTVISSLLGNRLPTEVNGLNPDEYGQMITTSTEKINELASEFGTEVSTGVSEAISNFVFPLGVPEGDNFLVGFNSLDDIPDGEIYVKSQNDYTDSEKQKVEKINVNGVNVFVSETQPTGTFSTNDIWIKI